MAQSLDYVQVDVTQGDGAAVAGTLSHDQDFDVLRWVPIAPWPLTGDEDQFEVRIRVDNAGILRDFASEYERCGADVDASHPFTVTTRAAPAIDPATDVTVGVDLVPVRSLGGLVCCDGAMPEGASVGSCTTDPFWLAGHCAGTEGVGYLDATLSFAAEVAGPYVARFVREGGAISHLPVGVNVAELRGDAEICGHFEILQGTGEVLSGAEVCAGGELVAQLGPQPVDPTAELEQRCTEAPYVCEVTDEERWDPDACVPWDGGPTGDTDTDGNDTEGNGDTEGDGTDANSDTEGDGGTDGSDTLGPEASNGGDSPGRGCACSAEQRQGGTQSWLRWVVLGGLAARRRRRNALE